MAKESCPTCKKMKQEGNPVRFRTKVTTCFVCKKPVDKILDLHHTNAEICSIECETKYWLDILY